MISEHERLDAFRRDQERKPPPKSAREKMDDDVRKIPWALPKKRSTMEDAAQFTDDFINGKRGPLGE